MGIALLVIGLVVGLVAGSSLGIWLVVQSRAALSDAAAQHTEVVRLAAERETRLREQLARAEASQATDSQMLAAFRSVSQEALASQSDRLLQLAEAKYGALQQHSDTVLAGHGRAVAENLARLTERLGDLERERNESTTALRAIVGELTVAHRDTQAEAARLAAAMRDNRVRGAWGEVQLRRVLELAGLGRHADFVEQRTVGDTVDRGRPDVIVPLPDGHHVVIDAKAPLDRYLEAANVADTDAQQRLLAAHAKAVAHHVHALSQRDYAAKVGGTVDMVLLFLPGEPFLAAALDADPSLFEQAALKGIHLVSPSSLLPVLRGIALGWREHRAERAAAEIQQLGVELHERIGVFADHFAKVGVQLDRTVGAFNCAVGSLDARLVSTARKLADHGADSRRELPDVIEIPTATRPIRMLELVDTSPPDAPAGVAAGR